LHLGVLSSGARRKLAQPNGCRYERLGLRTEPSFFCAPPLGSFRALKSRTLLEDFLGVTFVGLIATFVGLIAISSFFPCC
jgi:hypothetical protein